MSSNRYPHKCDEVIAHGTAERLMLIVHHDDANREYGYDRNSNFGKLDKALDEANAKPWTMITMKNDWKTIFPSVAGGGTNN